MKSTLKIDEFEVIIDGVGEQWLKQNHHFIVEAIQQAFEPFEHRNFDERIIDEIEIILPPSGSFDEFLNSLIAQLRSQIIDKYVLSVSKGTQINEAKTNVTNWNTIETLFSQLQYQIGSNSNLASQTLLEISQNISNNNHLIWRLLEKIGLSNEIFQAFQKWVKSENIGINVILLWMLQFIQNSKKTNQDTVDTIFLKTIFFSQFKNNTNLVSFSKINSDFINQILKLKNTELVEYLSYENSIESINALFSNYINEFDLLRNSIDVSFIQKLFKLNNAHFTQQQEPQKKEVLLYFNILKIANSLHIVGYQQLVGELNFYFFNVANRLFDFDQIIQIFQKYIPANQIKTLDALLEMVFHETKLINFNLNIETNLAELFKKIDLFIADNFSINSTEENTPTEYTEQYPYKVVNSDIIECIIQLNIFKNWPKEFAHFIPLWSQEIATFFKSGGTMSLKISAISDNERQKFLIDELTKIFQLVLQNQAENQNQLENYILGYAPLLNVLLINLIESVWEDEVLIVHTNNTHLTKLFENENAENENPQKNKILDKSWYPIFQKVRESKFIKLLNPQFIESLENLRENQLIQFLKVKFDSKFAENFILALEQLSSIENSTYQAKYIDLFIQWINVHSEFKSANFNHSEFLTYNQFIEELSKTDFDKYLQTTKKEVLNDAISLVKELTKSKEIGHIDEFSEEELKLWNSLIELSKEQNSHYIKRLHQLNYFNEIFIFIQKNWILSSEFKEANSQDFYDKVPTFLIDFFEGIKLKKDIQDVEDKFTQFIQFSQNNRVFKLFLIQYLSKQISKLKINKKFEIYLKKSGLNFDQLLDKNTQLNAAIFDDFEYFFNHFVSDINLQESDPSEIEKFNNGPAENLIPSNIIEVLEIVQTYILNPKTVNSLKIENLLLTFVNGSSISRSIFEAILKLEEKLIQVEGKQLTDYIKLNIEIGYFNILKLFTQDIGLKFPIRKIKSLKTWFNFTDQEIEEFEQQFTLFDKQLKDEIHNRMTKLIGEFKVSELNQNLYDYTDSTNLFVIHSWLNLAEASSFESNFMKLIQENYLSTLDKENVESPKISTPNYNSEIEEIVNQKPNLSFEKESELLDEVNRFIQPIVTISTFLEQINTALSKTEKSPTNQFSKNDDSNERPNTIENAKKKAAEKIEHTDSVKEWINQLEIQNQSDVLSLIDLQAVFNHLKNYFFKFIRPISIKSDLQMEGTSKFVEEVTEFEKFFIDLSKNPLFIKTPSHLKMVLDGYIQEIGSINLDENSLKNHLLFVSVFELLIQILQGSLNVPNIDAPEIQKVISNQKNIISFFQSIVLLQKDLYIPILTETYSSKNEFEIAKETKTIIDSITKSSHLELTNSLHPLKGNNLWFQTEIKIDTASIFNHQGNWKYLFNNQKSPIFIEIDNGNQLVSDDLKDSNKLLILMNHPDYKKWMVELGRNNAEGFLDLSSQISLSSIIQAKNEKFKGFNQISFDPFSVFEAFKPILNSSAILSLYQLTKFQFLQTQTPMTVLQIAEQMYRSYLSVESNKTFSEIAKVAQIIKEHLPLSDNELQLFNQFVNQQLPNQILLPQPNIIQIEIEKSLINLSKNFQVEFATLSAHVIKYPSISEKEILEQISIIFKEIKPQTDSEKNEILESISKSVWQSIQTFQKTGQFKKESQKFIQKIVQNWLEFKDVHWSIIRGFSSIEHWLTDTRKLLSESVNFTQLNYIHPTWIHINQIIDMKPIKQLSAKSVAYEPLEVKNLEIQGKSSKSVLPFEYDVNKALNKFEKNISEEIEIVSNRVIENQQNKEEEALIIPIIPKIPNILEWELLSQSMNEIDQSILSILLIEGLQFKNQVQINQAKPLGLNLFLAGKAFFRIVGHSSIPMQMIGLLYEGYFGYSMGMLEENWNQFIVPQNSKTLIEKLRTLRRITNPEEISKNWFNAILQNAESNPDSILKVNHFRLIIEEISELIFQKLQKTKFSKSQSSLQKKWISQLLFFKIIQYKDSDTEIGGYFSLLASESNKIDYWIHKIADYILFDIEVEYDFWILHISHLGNYLSESNVLTLFQLSESLKIINKENKLKIEDAYTKMLNTLQNRSFEEATLVDFIPELIPLFYDNQLSKTTQFRELSMLSLILNERNNISHFSDDHDSAEIVEVESLFERFKDTENSEISIELLREIKVILGKNTDETSRWILNEIALSDEQKLNRVTSKIQESYQSSIKIPNFFQTLLRYPESADAIQEIISPITINLKERPKTDSKIKREIENGTKFLTGLCGLMLLAPFLSTLFRRMGLLEKNEFISEMEQLKAYKALMTIPKIDETESFEFQDLIPRIITGIAPEDTINFVPELTDDEITELTNFLNAVISQWPVMANSTLRGFIESFLLRDGKVWKAGKVWKIEVNGHGADIILQTLTWGFATMKFPWTPYMIETDWKSP